MSDKLLKIVRRVRSAYAAYDRELAELEKALQPAPVSERKRRNLKEGRIDKYALRYAGADLQASLKHRRPI